MRECVTEGACYGGGGIRVEKTHNNNNNNNVNMKRTHEKKNNILVWNSILWRRMFRLSHACFCYLLLNGMPSSQLIPKKAVCDRNLALV